METSDLLRFVARVQKIMLKRPCIEVVDHEMAAVLRTKTGAERLKIANDMFVMARRMIASHLAAEHPEWDEEQIQKETSWRISHGATERMER